MIPIQLVSLNQALLLAEEKVVPFGVWKSVLYHAIPPLPKINSAARRWSIGSSAKDLRLRRRSGKTGNWAMAALSIVRLAFSSPRSIQLDEDKDPRK